MAGGGTLRGVLLRDLTMPFLEEGAAWQVLVACPCRLRRAWSRLDGTPRWSFCWILGLFAPEDGPFFFFLVGRSVACRRFLFFYVVDPSFVLVLGRVA